MAISANSFLTCFSVSEDGLCFACVDEVDEIVEFLIQDYPYLLRGRGIPLVDECVAGDVDNFHYGTGEYDCLVVCTPGRGSRLW